MTQYLVAIHHPDDYDPSVEDESPLVHLCGKCDCSS